MSRLTLCAPRVIDFTDSRLGSTFFSCFLACIISGSKTVGRLVDSIYTDLAIQFSISGGGGGGGGG